MLLTVALALALGVAVAACRGGEDGNSTSGPATTAAPDDLGLITPGTLVVATHVPYPPFELIAPDSDEITGFDVDLVTAIAGTLGIADVRFVDQPFDAIIGGLGEGAFDMSASAWTITPERAREVAFGDPYVSANQAILVRRGSAVRVLDDLRGKRIGAQRATVGADLATTVKGARVTRYASSRDAFEALAQGRVDAAVADYPAAAYAATRTPGLVVAAEVPGALALGLMFPRESTALRDAFDRGLADIRADGTYDAIHRKWFGEDPR